MKVCSSITDILAPEVGKPLIEDLGRIYPEGADGYRFRAVLPVDDPRVDVILSRLHKAGLRQEPTGKWNAYKPGKEFSVFRTVVYDAVDFEKAVRISWRPRGLYPQFQVENSDQHDPIALLLSLEATLTRVSFACTNFNHLLTTPNGRKSLEDNQLLGMSFVPAFFVDERSDVQELRNAIVAGSIPDLGEPPLWEVRPTVILPPMLPLIFKHRVNGEDRVSRNPIDVDRRMAYAKADLDKVGPFDFARPHPSEDPKQALVDPLVVSQRFFQFMKKQKNFDLNQWTPVREE